MPRKYAEVQVSIWDDKDFLALDEDAQRLYFLLMTRAELSLAGCINWHPGKLSKLAKNSTSAGINKAAKKLTDAHFIIIDLDTDECVLRSQVRHDGVLSRGPKLAGGVLAAWRAIYSPTLRAIVATEALRAEGVSDAVSDVLKPMREWACLDTPSDTPSDALSDTPSGTPPEDLCGQPTTNNQQPTTIFRSSADAEDHPIDPFDEFWTHYPRKTAKGRARTTYTKTLKKIDPARLLVAVKSYAERVRGSDPNFIPHASTWLNDERWDDTPLEPLDLGPSTYDGEAWMNR